MKHREERTWVQAYLDQEKHVLRHMQGKWTEIYGLFENMVDHICCKIEHCYWLRKAVFLSLTTVRRYVSPDSADFVEWVLYHRFFFGPFLLFCGPVSVAYFLTAVSLLTELLRAFSLAMVYFCMPSKLWFFATFEKSSRFCRCDCINKGSLSS